MDCFAALAMTAVSEEWDMPTRQNWFEGWRLFAVLALTLVALSLGIAGMRHFEVDGVRILRRVCRDGPVFNMQEAVGW